MKTVIEQGEIIKEIPVVLGGVASTPLRLNKVEDLLRGQAINEVMIVQSSELAVIGAQPFSHNAYKSSG